MTAGRGPWAWLPSRHDLPVFAIAAGLVVLVGFAMSFAGARMRGGEVTRRGRPGIVALELAGSAAAVRRIAGRWGAPGVAAARASIRWDFGWLVAYGAALSLAAAAIGARTPGTRAEVAGVLSWLAVAAAACDAVENALLLVALRPEEQGPAARGAAWFARGKFVLLGAVALGLFTACVPAPLGAVIGAVLAAGWLVRRTRAG